MTEDMRKALLWWENLTDEQKQENKKIGTFGLKENWRNLKDSDIEIIWINCCYE